MKTLDLEIINMAHSFVTLVSIYFKQFGSKYFFQKFTVTNYVAYYFFAATNDP